MTGRIVLADGTAVDLEDERLVRPDGTLMTLRPQAFAVLRHLLAHPNRLVPKADLMDTVWGDTAVTDDSLVQAVGEVRRALGEGGARVLVTHKARGYRLNVALPSDGPPLVAIGPFAALGGASEAEAAALALSVAAAASRSPDIAVATRADGARYRLDGTLQAFGTRLRATVTLVETATGTSLWAAVHEADEGDPFRRQDRLTESIAGALLPALHAAETRRAESRPDSALDARELVLRAMPLAAANTAAGAEAALALLDRALGIEPQRHAAHALAAWCHEQRFLRGGRAEAERTAALRHAEVALAMDCRDPDALALAAFLRANLTRDYHAALASIDRALILNPLSVMALGAAALVCAHAGHHGPAIAHAEKALRLSPADVLAYHPYCALALSHLVRGDYGPAVHFATRATRANTGFSVTHAYLAAAQAHLGDTEAAAFAAARLLEIAPGFTIGGFVRMDVLRNETAQALSIGLRLAGLPDEARAATACPPPPPRHLSDGP
jgi:DNA-binding winged helix-turn-helix (wHTH) protein/tetratricopeptide (TPR) repeat protein